MKVRSVGTVLEKICVAVGPICVAPSNNVAVIVTDLPLLLDVTRFTPMSPAGNDSVSPTGNGVASVQFDVPPLPICTPAVLAAGCGVRVSARLS